MGLNRIEGEGRSGPSGEKIRQPMGPAGAVLDQSDLVHESAQTWAGDSDPIADPMGEPVALDDRAVASRTILRRGEHGAQVEDDTVGPVVTVEELAGEILRVTTDPGHRTLGSQAEVVGDAVDLEGHDLATHRVEVEVASSMRVEQTDERADRGA